MLWVQPRAWFTNINLIHNKNQGSWLPTCKLNLQVLHTSRQAQPIRVVVHRHHPAAT